MTDLNNRIASTATMLRQRTWDEASPHSFPNRGVSLYRDQGENHDGICTVIALLSMCSDITPFVMRRVLDDTFNLHRDYNIDPKPLWGFNTQKDALDLLKSNFEKWPPDSDPIESDIVKTLKSIESNTLLGTNSTNNKLRDLNMLGSKSSTSIDKIEILFKDRIRILKDEEHRLKSRLKRLDKRGDFDGMQNTNDHLSFIYQKLSAFESFVNVTRRKWRENSLIQTFFQYPWFSSCPKAFHVLFADEIVSSLAPASGCLGDRKLHLVRGMGIEHAFVPRTTDFLMLGDLYGDCTASRVRSQVDPGIANINWTVCPWMLDPFYRVIQVLNDGEPALKAHVLPLIIDDRPVFMIDAIETVPRLRGEKRDGSEDFGRNQILYEARDVLLDTLFEVCLDLSHRMGIETIYVEKFSNARWVRMRLEELESETYQLSDVEKPYETSILEESIRRTLGDEIATSPRMEIQVRNTRLMHQNLLEGHKEVALLAGTRSNRRLRICGP